MIRTYLTTLVLLLTALFVPDLSAQTAPLFSDANASHWYYLVFTDGESVVEDEGVGQTATTHIIRQGKESQLWRLVGNADSFILENKLGNVAAATDFLTTSANKADAVQLRLRPATCPGYETSFEIEYIAKGDEMNRLNQWGGAGNGRRVGFYSSGESADAFTFLKEEDYKGVPVLKTISEFKTEGATGFTPAHRHTIWFDTPATAFSGDNWMEYGLPIGNGYFGAMTFGGVAQDRLQFNDKSLWTGSSLLRGCYQNFGDLYIEDISGTFDGSAKPVKNYVRYLDLRKGVSHAEYTSPDGEVTYTRDYIASNPDKVVAVRLAASEKGKINICLRLFNGIKKGIVMPEYKDGSVSFNGKLELVSFSAKVTPVVSGGKTATFDDRIEITGADEVIIYLAGATDFDPHSPSYISGTESLQSNVDSRIALASAKGWEKVFADHTADFSSYAERSAFELDASKNDRGADKLVTNYNGRASRRDAAAALMLEELYYAYGRYLLISSSRDMDSPANLQGIWNHSATPAWQCDIHSNINVQMNYWLAENTNLSELHMPYLNYIHSMVTEHPQWNQYALRSGQSKGWTCFTQNNIFGHSDYAENYVIANAWYSSHLWQHYLYTLDKEFLRDKGFPVMKSCAEFWMERLMKNSDGKWVAPKEWSPEHGPAEEDGTAHAQQILDAFFASVVEAVDVLGNEAGVSDDFITELRDKYTNLDKGLATETYTGKWGETRNGISNGDILLREWMVSDYAAGENEHRHQSHLMGLYPYSSITPESEWFTPAVNSLKLRGDVSTGWSLAWRIALWARALDAEHAHSIIKSALRHATSYGQSSSAGGVYYNLLDSHAPFQIDGNFGYTAAVTEMLLQSYNGLLRFLPALPSAWADGHINGVKGEGNFEVNLAWKSGSLTEVSVKSLSGLKCRIYYPGIAKCVMTLSDGSALNATATDDDHIEFETKVGETYRFVTESGLGGVAENTAEAVNLHLDGKRVVASDAAMLLTAYDIAGRKLAEGQGNLLLDVDPHTTVIVNGTISGQPSVNKKFIVR